MASHRKSARSLPMLGQVLPTPPACLTPQGRRLDCTWWGSKGTHTEDSSLRKVPRWMEMGVVQDSGNDQVLLPALLSCQMPSVPEGQTHVDAALGGQMWPPPQTWDDSPWQGSWRSPPAATPVETNLCCLANHLPLLWQERSPGCFSHKFFPNSLSGFPRQAKAITALQTTSYYWEQNCFSAWGNLENIPSLKQRNVGSPKPVAVSQSSWGTREPSTKL